jgi:hypothetical protein
MTKVLLVEIKGSFCDSEYKFVTQILYKRIPYKNSLRRIHWVVIFEESKGTTAYSKKIG